MRAVDNLPMGGKKFKSLAFKRKLKSSTKNNSLMREVSDHTEAINKAVSKYTRLIRKGGFNSTYQHSALRKIKSSAPLTTRQTMIVKSVLKRVAKVKKEDVEVSHARTNKSDKKDVKGPGMANQPKPANRSGLSDVASPTNTDRQSSRPMVSISQAQRSKSSGLAGKSGFGASSPPSRPSSIPLAR